MAVKDVVMEPTMKTLSDDLVQTPNLFSLPWRKGPRRWGPRGVRSALPKFPCLCVCSLPWTRPPAECV